MASLVTVFINPFDLRFNNYASLEAKFYLLHALSGAPSHSKSKTLMQLPFLSLA